MRRERGAQEETGKVEGVELVFDQLEQLEQQARAYLDKDNQPSAVIPQHLVLVHPALARFLPLGKAGRFDQLLQASVDQSADQEGRNSAYSVFFTRDAVITATQLLRREAAPPDEKKQAAEFLRQAILYVATNIGVRNRLFADQNGVITEETIGACVHEQRSATDPRAVEFAQRGWGFPYYGVIDGNGLVLQSLFTYLKKTNDYSIFQETILKRDGHKVKFAQVALEILDWILNRMESNPAQLVQAFCASDSLNRWKGWQDGGDSYFDDKGREIDHNGFSPIEVHGQIYDALVGFEKLLEQAVSQKAFQFLVNCAIGRAELLVLLKRVKAKKIILEKRLKQELVAADGGIKLVRNFYLQDGELVSTQVANTGILWLLQTDFMTPELAQDLIDQSWNTGLMSAYGLRTVSADFQPKTLEQEGEILGYDPESYHRGSVWAMDQMQIVIGLLKQGYYGLAIDLSWRVVAQILDADCFPELVKGDSTPKELKWTAPGEGEPHAQPVQTWTISAFLLARDVLQRAQDGLIPTQAQVETKRELEKECLARIPELAQSVQELAGLFFS